MSAAPGTAIAPPRAECVIDLGALRHNVRTLGGRLAGDAQLWAVVKANAYGHDVDRVAEALVASGVRRLCVATLSEARQLRSLGIRVPILVMGPLDAPSMRRAIDLDVSVTVLSPSGADALVQAAADSGAARLAKVHLKVDTGMGRWGVPRAAARELLERLLATPDVEVEGLMTHLATADDEGDDGFMHTQLDAFDEVVAMARELDPDVTAHAANSAATLRDERSHHDAVRCGVALYGLDPMQRDAAAHDLRPVLSLASHVADIRDRAPGESVGYGRTFVADRPVRVAIVPIGYADGVRRALSNVGAALVRGRRLPIVGNVSMDQVALLLDDDATVEVGDVVTLLGRDGDEAVTAEDHARWASTINYEITCGIADEPRLVRVHRRAGAS